MDAKGGMNINKVKADSGKEYCLPINENPYIRVFPQYAFIDFIINNENTNISRLCNLYIENFDNYNWNYRQLNAEIRFENKTMEISRRGYGARPIGGFFCECSQFEQITFCIPYQQYTNIWDRITFFLEAGETQLFSDAFHCSYEFSIHCCKDWRIDVKDVMVYYEDNRKKEKKNPKWYNIKKQGNCIKLYCSFDGKKWDIVNSVEVKESNAKKIKMGFHIHLYGNQYHKWICNNFIQYKYDRFAGKPVDYVGLLNRDWRNYAINPIVRFSYDKVVLIQKRGLWEYIIDNIKTNRYVEIWLNEYFIQGLEAFHEYAFIHESLIYGIEEKQKYVKLVSFKNGKPIFLSVSFEVLEVAWKDAIHYNPLMYTFEFSPDEGGYDLDVSHIYKQLKDYIVGRNSSVDFQYIAEKEAGVFGNRIYKKIMEEEDNKNTFLKDERIAYIMREHKKCMAFRMEYLHEYGIITSKDYAYIKEAIDKIQKLSQSILGLVLKNKIFHKTNAKDKIWDYMEETCLIEQKCYSAVLESIEKYLCDKE